MAPKKRPNRIQARDTSGGTAKERNRRALEDCEIVRHDTQLAAAFANRAVFVDFREGEKLTVEGEDTDDVFLILRGSVAIEIGGRTVDHRRSGQLVGEMEAIEPLKKRTATVRGLDAGIAAKISGADFLAILQQHPSVWRHIALDFSDRLQYRTRVARRLPNATPRVFVGSSAESQAVAMAIQVALPRVAPDVTVQVWSDNQGFKPGQYPIDELLDHVDRSDFALFILAADDLVTSRGKKSPATRDNVVFEVGLFMGALGRSRTLIVSPKANAGSKPIKIWSDILGLTRLEYEPGTADDLVDKISPSSINSICLSIARVIALEKIR